MIVIANWKQNLTLKKIENWFDLYKHTISSITEVVIAPSFPLILKVTSEINERSLNITTASQDISEYKAGAHTGEVGAKQLKGLVKYAIIGHSERRANGETAQSVNDKIARCVENAIIPLVCFGNITEFNQIIKVEGTLYAYEPVNAISTSGVGKPASIEDISKIRDTTGLEVLIYGGSIDKKSVGAYLGEDFISGFLVGSTSLNSIEFSELVGEVIKKSPIY